MQITMKPPVSPLDAMGSVLNTAWENSWGYNITCGLMYYKYYFSYFTFWFRRNVTLCTQCHLFPTTSMLTLTL